METIHTMLWLLYYGLIAIIIVCLGILTVSATAYYAYRYFNSAYDQYIDFLDVYNDRKLPKENRVHFLDSKENE